MTAVISPQDGAPNGQRSYTLPDCAPGILAQLERAARIIDRMHEKSDGRAELLFYVNGNTAKLRITTLLE